MSDDGTQAQATSPTLDFRQLLKKNSTEVERPKLLPDGHYYGLIGTHSFGKSSQKQTPFVRFMVQAVEVTDDVDPETLEGINISQRELRADYYITQAALSRLSDMLDAVVGEPERSIEERIPETRGLPVLIFIGHRDNEAGTQSYNEVKALARDTRNDN